MQPTPKSAHKDSALTNLSIGFRQAGLIADLIFPSVRVMKQSDYYFKFLKGAWFRNEARVRGPGAKAARGTYPITSELYKCVEYALSHPVPIELINNADQVLKPFETGVRFATSKVLLAKEVLASTLITTAGNWTTSDDVAAGWVADSNSTFIADIEAQKEVVRKLIGRYPNTLMLEAKTFKAVKQTPSVLDRIKYGGTPVNPAVVNASTIAQLFDLERVVIGSAIYSSAEEVAAGTDWTAVDLWETNATKGAAWLGYVSPEPAIDVPSAGYTFNWGGDDGQADAMRDGDEFRSVRYWWDSDTKSWIVEASEYLDVQATCADAGCLFYDTLVT